MNPAAIKIGDSVHLFYRAVRKGNHSTIGYCKLDGPLHIADRHITPLLTPELPNESMGIEDARIVEIDDLYYLYGRLLDGLEEIQVNLNQGAESTVCYLMARLTVEQYKEQMKKW